MRDPNKRHRKTHEDELEAPLNASDDIERGTVDAGETSEEAQADERLIHPYISHDIEQP